MSWMPTPEQFQMLRAAGLVTLALVFGPRLMPPLQPYARMIAITAATIYVLGGLAVFAWHAFAGG
jgi:hypothetical protein